MYRLASDHQPQVRLQQVILRPPPVLGDPLQVDPRIDRQARALGELLLGEQARLDPLGQLHLLLGIEQRDLADLLQVVLDRIRRRAGDGYLRGRQVIVIIAEDEDLIIASGASGRGLGLRGGLRTLTGRHGLRVVGVLGVAVVGQIGLWRVGDLQVRAERVAEVLEVFEVLEVDRLVVEIVRVLEVRDRQVARDVLGRHHRQLVTGVLTWMAVHSHVSAAVGRSLLVNRSIEPALWHPRVLARGAGRPGALARRGVGSAHHHGHLFLRWVASLSCVRIAIIGPSREGLGAWTVPGSKLPACRLGDFDSNPPASSFPPP